MRLNCYIHVPFCASKCGYCAFYSESGTSVGQIDAYLDHLSEVIVPETLETLYIGGGTPTIFDLPRLARFVGILDDKFAFIPGAERSIEANPETLTAEKVALLRKFFTRISLGVQSFDPALRMRIGRKCSQQALDNAIELIREADFPHWNCDLIYSLPDENEAQWENDLHRAVQLGVDHISCYSLTAERTAALGAEFIEDDIREKAMYEKAQEILSACGICRYEISNYARSGSECRHNVNVWCGGLLRAYGPTAAGFDGIDRFTGADTLEAWLAGTPPEIDRIAPEKRLNEIFAVNLRSVAGWTPGSWSLVPNSDNWTNRVEIARKTAQKYPGCLQISPDGIKLSADGLLFWNDIAADLL
ncbi:MAG: coproporphyrinogen III oxidase family protein [Lentisphaerae bacterium]|nr:coproporphyrinogen III oxidase family protein [Lentisphaerota bacterium]